MKQDTKKLIAYIVFALLAVALCYLFIVVYFYYINPYDISVKLAFWPLQSDKSLSELYMDSVVEVSFNVKGDFEENETISITGVNVRKDGFVVCPYHTLSSMQEGSVLSVKDSKGNVYNGKLLYSEKNLDVAIIKCVNIQNEKAEIKIPFVKYSGVGQENVLIVNSPLQNGAKYAKSSLVGYCIVPFVTEKDDYVALDYVWENAVAVSYNQNILDGIVFDRDAHVLGFSCPDKFDFDSKDVNVFLPISNIELFFDNVVEKYYNDLEYDMPLANLFLGLDRVEFEYNYDLSMNIQEEDYNNNPTNFYFDGTWQPYTDDIIGFILGEVDGFYLLKPFVYKDVQIDANSRIDYVKVNGTNYTVFTRCDLMLAIHHIESGDEVTIVVGNNESAVTQNVQFTYLEEENEEI